MVRHWEMLKTLNFGFSQEREYASDYDIFRADGYFRLLADTVKLKVSYVMVDDKLAGFVASYIIDPAKTGDYDREIGLLLGVPLDSTCHIERARLDLVVNDTLQEGINCHPLSPGETVGRVVSYGAFYSWFRF